MGVKPVKSTLFKRLDRTLGQFLCQGLGLMRRPRRPLSASDFKSHVHHIGFIKLVAIGDLMVILPTLQAFKTQFPDKKITLITSRRVRAVVEGHSFIDQLIYFDPLGEEFGIKGFWQLIKRLRSENLDLICELSHYYRFISLITFWVNPRWVVGFNLPNQGKDRLQDLRVPYLVGAHEVFNYFHFLTAVGGTLPDPIKLVKVARTPADEAKIQAKAPRPKTGKLIAVHPGTSHIATGRQWPVSNWETLIQTLSKSHTLILVGGPDEADLITKISLPSDVHNAINQFSLAEFSALCDQVEIYIGLDTGPTHIAAASDCKVIALYGPNTPQKWGPYGAQHTALYKANPSSPCIRQYEGVVGGNCKNCSCMTDITTRDVLDAVAHLV